LTLIPGHRESHLDFLHFAPAFQARQKEDGKQTTLETRFATNDDNPLRAIVGAFYYRDNTESPISVFNLQDNAEYQSLSLKTESKALFGRLTYAITPEIRLTAGARQTWEDKSINATQLALTRVCFVPLAGGGCPTAPPVPYGTTPPDLSTFPSVTVPAFGLSPFGGFPDVIANPNLAQFAATISNQNDQKFRKFTWRVGADWDITPHNLLYVSYETGFKAGGFFIAADNPATPQVEGVYKPETIGALTIGSKNRFMDNRLQLNAEAFYWKYKDQQLSHLGFDYLGNVNFPTENVGKATFKGFEIETQFAATHSTTLTADLQYLDAKYDEFVYTTPNFNGGVYNGTGCQNVAPPGLVYTVACSGKRPPNAPEWTLNLGAEQRVPVSFGEFVINARAHYQSETLVGLEFTPFEEQKAYWLADAQVTYYPPGRKYFVGAFVNNIFDETLKQQTSAPVGNLYPITLRPPRLYGVRAGVNF
jgi:iron complex outermembrane receptor protein